MNLLIIAPFFPPDPTGSSRYAYDLALELCASFAQVTVITNSIDKKAPPPRSRSACERIPENLEIIRVRALRVNFRKLSWNYSLPLSVLGLATSREIWSMIRSKRFDRVLVHSVLFDLSLFGLVFGRIGGMRPVVVAHTAVWHDLPIVRGIMRLYGRLVLRPLIEWTKAWTVAVERWTFDNALELFARPDRISLIPVPIRGPLKPLSAQSRDRNVLGAQTGPLLLSLGHVVPLRNRVRLMECVARLKADFPGLVVVIVGEVRDEEFLRVARRLGVYDCIRLIGAVPHDEIAEFLAAADLEVHDLDGRALGLTSVEAMSSGVPIVASVHEDFLPGRDTQRLAEFGLLVDASVDELVEVMGRLLRDREFREQVVVAQKSFVDETYLLASVTKQFEDLLREV